MRSNFARIGIAALLVVCSVGCHDASVPAAAETKPTPQSQLKPAVDTDCEPPEGPADRPGYCSYPADVRAFVDDRDGCDHWRGEPWPEHADDPQEIRKKQILDAIEKTCAGTDKRLSSLKAAHAGDPRVLRLLDEFEPDIETDD